VAQGLSFSSRSGSTRPGDGLKRFARAARRSLALHVFPVFVLVLGKRMTALEKENENENENE
jgi:hypothetical protein